MVKKSLRRKILKVKRRHDRRGTRMINLASPEYHLKPLLVDEESLPKCYAAPLGGCKGTITAEHFISENLLKQVDILDPDGFPWLKGKTTKITPSTLTANCLCEYHNNFLSPLDALAGKVFKNFSELGDPNAESAVIWGPSIERWFLKVLVGLVGAKVVEVSGQRMPASSIPIVWLEILFGIKDFTDGKGLYLFPRIGEKIEFKKGFRIETLLLKNELQGISADLCGIKHILTMAPKEEAFNLEHPDSETLLYRPRAFNINNNADRIRWLW